MKNSNKTPEGVEKQIKRIVIKQEITEEGTKTSFKVDGFNDFEVIGLLAYYRDICQVSVMRKSEE